MPKHSSSELPFDQMLGRYREIRKRVWRQATAHPVEHQENQVKLQQAVSRLCDSARIECYAAPCALWAKMWRTIRYAGIKASIASNEITDLASVFDDYRTFVSSDWDEDSASMPYGGRLWRAYMAPRRAAFPAARRVRNVHKLRKTVRAARALNAFVESNKDSPATALLAPAGERSDWRDTLTRLRGIGYGGDLTALHLMMDIGLPVVKPDIVLTKLFLAWGWLHAPSVRAEHEPLPGHLSFDELRGRFLYTRPSMYERVIDLAAALETRLVQHSGQLRADIGWVSSNPLREFDIFVVKYGQEPEPAWGITSNLAKVEIEGWSRSPLSTSCRAR